MGGMSDPRIIDSVTGDVLLVYFRTCDKILQFVYVGPTDPIDIAETAYQQVSALVRRPEVTFSPPIDTMIVNFETWLGVHSAATGHRDRSHPRLVGNGHCGTDQHRMVHRIECRRRHHQDPLRAVGIDRSRHRADAPGHRHIPPSAR